LRNVEDGISVLGSSGLDTVDTQSDGVAGLVGSSSSTSSTSLADKKKLKKDENKPTGFVYRVLRELVSKGRGTPHKSRAMALTLHSWFSLLLIWNNISIYLLLPPL
jgi:hypothetical protein